MNAYDVAEAISLSWSFPCIALCGLVVCLWYTPAVKAFKTIIKNEWWKCTSENRKILGHCWFVLGVAIGFFGDSGDSSYWLVPWSLAFTKSSSAPYFMSLGVFFNIPFRQIAGTISAYCHVRSAICYGLPGICVGMLHKVFFFSLLIGIFYTCILYFVVR